MTTTISPAIVAEVRANIDLAALVSEHVTLSRSGRGLLGLCPFHKEKTPSFRVDPERGRFHCFGCGVHGDAIDFEMRTTGATFPAAVRRLAVAAGLRVSSRGPSSLAARLARSRRESAAHELAAIDAEFAKRWHAAIEELDDARDDATLLRALMRDDPEGAKPSTDSMIRELGDPYLRAELALERAATIDVEWRAWREQSGHRPDTSWGMRLLEDRCTLAELDRGIAVLAEMVAHNQEVVA